MKNNMALRDHPCMVYRNLPNWPPVWTKTGSALPRGEYGRLVYVHANPPDHKKCFLVTEYQGEKWIGCLLFDDSAFCRQLVQVLKGKYGRTIKEIGDLDVSFSL